ncbi:MAG TPA: RNA methyltransferase [Syntrophomonadaceae bacterium]|nr:RNA methyltransferase [Syntrophomonadaceae bacterium]
MKQISSRDNPLVKQASSLKIRKYRYEEQMFLLEGERALNELLPYRHRLVHLFIQEGMSEKYAQILSGIDEDRVVMVNASIMKVLSDTQHPQGIVAVVSMGEERELKDTNPESGLWLLLDRISDPGNLGTMIRTCWALDGAGILLTPGCVDPYSPKVCRSSMGGILNLPIISNVGHQEIDFLIKKGFRMFSATAASKQIYYQTDLTGPAVLMVGSEAHGIDPLLECRSSDLLQIPMKSGVNSLNAASACAIIMSEAMRQRYASSLS